MSEPRLEIKIEKGVTVTGGHFVPSHKALDRSTLLEVYRRWWAWYGGKADAECFGDWLEQQLDPSFDPSKEPLGRFAEKSATKGTRARMNRKLFDEAGIEPL